VAKQPTARVIQDDDGTPHNYMIACHPAVDGLRLAQQLFALAGPSLGKLIEGLRGAGASSSLLDLDLDLGALLNEVSQAVASSDLPGLVSALLRHTVRDSQMLNNDAMINQAFGGNYGEIAEAVSAVVEVNGFHRFFLRLAARGQGATQG
jgi:hypothetical protein